VQDAGHELRTPLTSLRTNISLLERFDDLTPEVRARVLADLKGESRELTGLVNEVLALAGGQAYAGDVEPLRLAGIAESVAIRARRRTGREVTVAADDCVVEARRGAVERAVWNLVDNAAKFDASGSPIEIVVREGTIDVLDRGPGVADEDAAHIFDRFYRPVASRSLPGSGLGLSIVKDVAESAGGSVHVTRRTGGGSIIGMTFPQARG
jgi:two-component system sensor histidine kinase MprB